uniref:Transmembrane protein 138 n=1 Tax=Panagrellus redivivus TaxID=6233 RepID=A0A7E4UTT9_PANRE
MVKEDYGPLTIYTWIALVYVIDTLIFFGLYVLMQTSPNDFAAPPTVILGIAIVKIFLIGLTFGPKKLCYLVVIVTLIAEGILFLGWLEYELINIGTLYGHNRHPLKTYGIAAYFFVALLWKVMLLLAVLKARRIVIQKAFEPVPTIQARFLTHQDKEIAKMRV